MALYNFRSDPHLGSLRKLYKAIQIKTRDLSELRSVKLRPSRARRFEVQQDKARQSQGHIS